MSEHDKQIEDAARKMEASATTPLEKLRAACLKRGASGIKGLGRVFRVFDDDRSRSLNFDEFSKGVHDYGITSLSRDELKELFSLFDKDGSGTIDYEEFLVRLRPPVSSSRVAIIETAFNKVDKTGDGVVTVDDLKGVYNYKNHQKYRNGEWTSTRVFEEFLKAFEPDPNLRDARVTKKEFIDYYSGLSASIDEDSYFEMMMRNAWKL